MPRYIVGKELRRARKALPATADYWDAGPQPLPLPTVYPTNEPTPTGLVTADGRPIYRAPERLGFLPEHD